MREQYGEKVTLSGSNVPDTQPIPTKQIGSISQLFISNAVAIVDTNAVTGSGQDVSGFQAIALRIKSTLNQTVNITLLEGDTSADGVWATDKTGLATSYQVTIPANTLTSIYITDKDWYALKFINFANVRYQCTTAPTSGSLTVKVIGRR
jgi:hypothetical protein